jgi:hypothetical protein
MTKTGIHGKKIHFQTLDRFSASNRENANHYRAPEEKGDGHHGKGLREGLSLRADKVSVV